MQYKSSVYRDLKGLDKGVAKRILDAIDRELSENVEAGKPLTGRFKGLYSYRIGEYRVIYSRTEDCVLILRIGHRSTVYR